MSTSFNQYLENVYNNSFEQKQNKSSVQQELPKILDFLKDFDENFKSKIFDKFSAKETLDIEQKCILNCFNVSINIIGIYFEDEALESEKEISYLVNKIFQYIDEFHKFIDINIYARRITEVLLYCLCNIVEKIDLNKIVNYPNENLQKCFKNSNNFPLLELSSAIISAFMISHNHKIYNDLLKYLEGICNVISNKKLNELHGIDKNLIEYTFNNLKEHQNNTFPKNEYIYEINCRFESYRGSSECCHFKFIY